MIISLALLGGAASVRQMFSLKGGLVIVALACLLPFGGCSRGPGAEIEAVLNECARLSQQVNESKMNSTQAALFLADKMQEIDTRKCPQDFRVAFQQHINAWRNAASAFDQNTPLNTFFEAFAAGLLKDFSQLGASQQTLNSAIAGINSTYERLTEIATSHGARVPRSVVGA